MVERGNPSEQELKDFQLRGETEIEIGGRMLVFYRGEKKGVTVVKSETPWPKLGLEVYDLCASLWKLKWPEFLEMEVRTEDPHFVLIRLESKF